MARGDLAKLVGTRWVGVAELWLDELGNEAHESPCTMSVDDEGVRYTWQHEGKAHEGAFALRESGGSWMDSWHQPKGVACADVPGAWGLFALHYTYPAGEGPDWGWRMNLAQRPTGELVLQMTNITPWGEEGRAVRMVLTKA